MKKLLCSAKTLIVLLVVTVLSLGFYVYMLIRPVSYGMGYTNVTEYEGDVFKGTMKFKANGKMLNSNTNFDQVLKSRYFYFNGYVFYLASDTDEKCAEEIELIKKDFNNAIVVPFYSDEVNAFRLVASEGDGYSTVYTCKGAIAFAVVFGVIEVALLGLTSMVLVLYKKNKK